MSQSVQHKNFFTGYSLQAHNTFGIDVKADLYSEFHSVEELTALLSSEEIKQQPLLILGGGSNVLLTKDVKGVVLRNCIRGIEVIKEDSDYVWVKAGAGEVWHEMVMYCIEEGYAGIENLSLIPGTVGAAPMQNIGAYGVELKDVFDSLEAVHLKDLRLEKFDNAACRFGYRESIFKKEHKGNYIIVSVTLRLNKKATFNTSYGAIASTLDQMGVRDLNIKTISDAVIHIRRSKLPDPAVLGNAGSFFKNPEIPESQYLSLKKQYPEIPSYPVVPGKVKVPAGWLIEQCEWKGKTFGTYGVHKHQALVLVNYGGATGKEIQELSEKIKESVKEKFGVELETEVNII